MKWSNSSKWNSNGRNINDNQYVIVNIIMK